MPIRPFVGAVAALSLSVGALAQNDTPDPVDQRIDEILRANTHAIAIEGSTLGGPGGELLLREASAARFLCLGEAHLVNEVPALTEALLHELRDDGYTNYAIETGERIADSVEAAFQEDPEFDGRIFAEIPFTAAFIDHAPDFANARTAVELGYDLWGLDQVFMGGARFNLLQLIELAPDDEAKSIAEKHLKDATERFLAFMRGGGTSGAFITSAPAETFDELREAFAGVDEAARIIDEMRASGEIYRLYQTGKNYESNKARIDLMKRHFAERVRTMGEGEKAILRFGSMHMGRGHTDLHQLDLGNAASEIGLLLGGGSLHVQLTALGLRNGDGTVRDFTTRSDVLARLARVMGESPEPSVVDLRPLRPVFHDDAVAEGREELDRTVWRYDLLVVWPELTRAEPLPGVPSPPGR